MNFNDLLLKLYWDIKNSHKDRLEKNLEKMYILLRAVPEAQKEYLKNLIRINEAHRVLKQDNMFFELYLQERESYRLRDEIAEYLEFLFNKYRLW